MLTALEQGVKGGKWFSLIDKVYSRTNLRAAFTQVAANQGAAGVDHVTIAKFDERSGREPGAPERSSCGAGTYRPQAIRRHYIPKPGSQEKRPLGIPTVRDRVVQTALRHVLEPIFERDFAEHSYGFRPGRGCKDALRRVDELLKAGYVYVVDADLKSYFDTIPHDRLMAAGRAEGVGRAGAEADRGVPEARHPGRAARNGRPRQGTPQGAVLSPLLSNIYLDPLDHLMAGQGFEMVRYADDFVILCRSPEEAAAALAMVQAMDGGSRPDAAPDQDADRRRAGRTALTSWAIGSSGGRRWPRPKSLQKLKDTIRAKTKRTNGHSLSRDHRGR